MSEPPETAPERIGAFWRRAADRSALSDLRALRQAAAMRALLGGRPRLFGPTLPGLWAMHPLAPDDDHIHSTAPMRRALLDLIDFDRLNDGGTRLIVNALDQQTAEDVVFDSADAADALAIAICHARHLQGRSLRIVERSA